MSVPGIVQSTLNGEEIAARVSLGGEDELFITPSSTLVYRSDGLLSDESVDELPHNADRLTLSEGRRKTKFTLEYPLEETRSFSVPSSKTDAVLHPVLAGVLNGNGITDPGETVVKTYRFSELTLLITSARLVKHIGGAVWDSDYEEYHFGDVTSLAFEDGSVATQIVLTVDGRPQRIKAPNEEANDLRERLQRALFEYHDVGSLEELNETIGGDEEADQDRERTSVDFGDGVAPLDANPPELDDDGAISDPSPEEDAQSVDPLTETTAGTDSNAGGSRADQVTGQDQRDSRPPEQERAETNSKSDGEPTALTHESDTTVEMSADTPVESETDLADTGTDDTEASERQVDPGSVIESPSILEPDATGESDAGTDDADELLERIDSLEDAVERQHELLEHQQQTIEQLIVELRNGR
ncbi:DUF7115 domain-containing protein [Natronorubrum halophilum]|uniref:DUF7115 domain-containing protein n=1 Tax=Natronorubrum halophilum TaxID=1702106 RepID=UPI0010C1838F|nr:hypothetical protein [Natronorubrum halophilum]